MKTSCFLQAISQAIKPFPSLRCVRIEMQKRICLRMSGCTLYQHQVQNNDTIQKI